MILVSEHSNTLVQNSMWHSLVEDFTAPKYVFGFLWRSCKGLKFHWYGSLMLRWWTFTK